MSWVKLDDHFPIHRKTLEAGPLALAMNVAAICYSARELTNGYVSKAILPSLVDLTWLPHRYACTHQMLADKLVAAGVWEPMDEGFRIHDYLEYNPSREQVLEERERAKNRMNTRRSSGEVRANNMVNTGRSSATPVTPYPVPEVPSELLPSEPEGSSGDAPDGAATKRATRFPEHFELGEDVYAWAETLEPPLYESEVNREAEKWRDHHLAKGTTAKDWQASLRSWLRNASDIKAGRSPFGSKTKRGGHTGATSSGTGA